MKGQRVAPSDSSSKNSARGPFRILCLCRGSLATSVPAKVVGLEKRTGWLPHWPTDLWGDCGYRRSDRRRRRRE
jgi:hypothetical protein